MALQSRPDTCKRCCSRSDGTVSSSNSSSGGGGGIVVLMAEVGVVVLAVAKEYSHSNQDIQTYSKHTSAITTSSLEAYFGEFFYIVPKLVSSLL